MNNKMYFTLLVVFAVLSMSATAQTARPHNPRAYDTDVLLDVFKLSQADSDVPFDSLMQACPARDCIPSIDQPIFVTAGEVQFLRDDDLVLTVTEILRAEGVVGKFVEYFGTGVNQMSVADRAILANMSPEYGSTMGFFAIDQNTLDYLRLTGRSDEEVDLVERYTKEQQLFRTDDSPVPTYTKVLTLECSDLIAG